MTIALFVGRDEHEMKLYHWLIDAVISQLLKLDPHLDIQVWPDIHRPEQIDLVIAWRHPIGRLKNFSNLKCIASLGAGVDHLMIDAEIPKKIPIIRVMDAYMANDIVQYVLTYVLHHIKRVDHWDVCQQKNFWGKQPPFNFSHKIIGIMGLGFLGRKAAESLQYIGLNVIGWSNSSKNIPGIKDFVGKKEFDLFLSQTDILVCMLPLTPHTKNILNRDTFAKLKPGACLINLGRGEHLVEEDLIFSLREKHIASVYLDVFQTEPLPPDHPFWNHPNIHVTPHIASVTNPTTATPQLMDAYRKLLNGDEITNRVDSVKGY